jgi:hypothetical protein
MKINDLQTITDDVVEAARSTLGTWTAAHAVVRGPSVSAENRRPLSTPTAPFNPPVCPGNAANRNMFKFFARL